MLADLFEEKNEAGEDALDGAASGRARAVSRRAASAAPSPGVWKNCAEGLHRLCAVEVLVQAPWATAGHEPPSPFDAPAAVERCACDCGHPGEKR